MTLVNPVVANPAATVRADSAGRRRLSIQYREYESKAPWTPWRSCHDVHVGLTRRRCRSIIARRSALAKLAPAPIGVARPSARNPGSVRASRAPVR